MTTYRPRRARLAALILAVACMPAAAYDWLQFNGDPQHSGNNTRETLVHRNNVGRLVLQWQATLPSSSDGAPVFLEGVATPSGTKDLLFVTTTAGHILAIDAATGATIWSHQYGAGTCRINNGASNCYTTSSPAIDPNRQFVYSYGLDGKVHKYQAGDGTEIVAGGWPQVTTLKGFDEKNASALAFATVGGTTYLYSVNGGYPGDNGDYQGHVTTINLGTGSQTVFNILCSNQTVHLERQPATPNCGSARAAVWSRGGVTYHAGTNRVFMATGNGNFNGSTGGFNWGDSIVAMNPDGTGSGGKPVDAYTPTNQSSLEAADADLGSTGPLVLPAPAGSNYPHIGLQSGKDSKIRLVNLANLNGTGAPGPLGGEIATIVNVPQGGVVLTQPAAWVNLADATTWAFVVNGSGASGLRVDLVGGNPSLSTRWQIATGGASPIVANNLLYYAGGNAIRALDTLTGSQLWSSTRIGGTHWQSPIVANGGVYIADQGNKLTAYKGGGAGLAVDVRTATGTSSNTNGILEPGESVVVEPGWRNLTAASVALTGTAASLTGPVGATYTINDSSAGYGTIAAGASADCFASTGNCYRVTVSNPVTRPGQHWDVVLRETLSTGDAANILLHVGASFTDVPVSDIMYGFIENLVHNGVTLGFGDGTFQPLAGSVRGATAMFVARATAVPNGDGGLPISGTVGAQSYNCVPGGTSVFPDVVPTDVWCKQVHTLAARGVDVAYGCTGGHACPSAPTTRGSMAVIVAGAVAGSDAAVPAYGTYFDSGGARNYNCNPGGESHFPDVAPTDTNCRHVNYLWARGMIDGYLDGTFKPALPVSRGQMAKFITNGFRLALYQ
ncbi:MAG: S-layer homology domain-containing protein [Burkholderiales bacterium]